MADEAIYQLLFERNPLPMWVYDSETLRFLAVNDAAIRHYGYSREEFLAMTVREIRPPEELPGFDKSINSLPAGPGPLGLWRHRRKNGEVIDVEISGNDFVYHGRASRVVLANDVTARLRAEQETRRLGERLTATVESITDAFYTLDHEWCFTFLNRAAEAVMGTREELLGRVVWDVFPEVLGTNIEAEYRRAMREHVPVRFETLYAPFNRCFEVRAFPTSFGLAVYFHDITLQHEAAERLRIAEERFRLLSRVTNDAVWDWDIAADTLWWSEGLEALFGFTAAEVEPSVDAWTKRIHPDDRDRVAIGLHDAVDQGADAWTDEYRFQKKDGSWAHVRDRGHVVRDAEGRPVRMVGGMSDITAQRAAEEQLGMQASLIDAARDAIILRDLEQRVLFWSKGAETIYGFTSGEAVGRLIPELLRPEAARFTEATHAVITTGAWTGEIRKMAKNGEGRTLDCRWTLLRDARGVATSILTIDTDVTERKRLEQQFLRAQRMESIGTLAGGIAHDLNNVLTPIMMSIELLRMDETDAERLDTLSVIEQSAKQGSAMVRQVLSFARGVEGRRMEIQPAHLLRDIEKLANETFLKTIRFETDIPHDLWTVTGDPTQLHQVLMNLSLNARDAMPDGGVMVLGARNVIVDEIALGPAPDGKPGPHVCLWVEDSGTGMSPEVMERIFDPFFTTKEVGKGTGLGLSTSLGIVRSHGGFIRVYSEPGRGTTFRVYLPAQTTSKGAAAPEAPAPLMRGRGETILLVDDEAAVRSITRQTLESFGYRVITATDGAEAIDAYRRDRKRIDLVVTDMMMPVMDGAALIHVLFQLNPQVRVIAVSGLGASAQLARTAGAGVKRFLPKPYSADILLRAVREALDAPAP